VYGKPLFRMARSVCGGRPVRLIDDIGSQAAGVEEMANAAGPRRVNDVVVLPHPLPKVRARRGDEQQLIGAVE
jgi:hypothetical protein